MRLPSISSFLDKNHRKTLLSLLIRHIIAFAILFFALALVMFRLTNESLYKQVDSVINQTMDKTKQVIENKQETSLPEHLNTKYALKVILWDKNSKPITRSATLRDYTRDKHIVIEKNEVNRMRNQEIKNNDQTNIYYRTLICHAPKNNYGIKYIEVAVITNQIHETLLSLHKMIGLAIIIFWTLSLTISIILAKYSMRPILSSWEKQKQFVENASHELKTPLAVIQAKLEQLLMHPKHTIIDEAENISISLNEVRRLSRLTNDLTTLTKADQQHNTLAYQTVNIHEFITDIERTYTELISLNHRHLIVNNQTTDEEIRFDPQLIQQLLAILIDNAIKYTNDDGHIEIDSFTTNNQWICIVKDDGIGVDDKDKKHLFERFYRVDSSRTRQTGGSGLGLSLAKWIIDGHHGTIKALNNSPKGLMMKITIPLK